MFIKGISLFEVVYLIIERLVKEWDWNWVLIFYLKLYGFEIVEWYKYLVEFLENVRYLYNVDLESVNEVSVLLCDSLLIILEFMM